ncbi:hypothetical protein ACFQGT_04985 [Natrialbaceae archaeon GCM10025810]|uniref:DUF7524 family protein n=1 Tax=Halovalidus salilacus TaxID=3075124 RepID=UPI00361B1F10
MAPTEVTVHVNRGRGESLEADRHSVEADDSFDVVLRGHGGPAHVHCRLEGDLADVASLERSNYYVEDDGETTVRVAVAADAFDDPVTGSLEVSTGYGAISTTIDVTVRPGPAEIDVDESLAQPTASATSDDGGLLERATSEVEAGTLGVVALGALAIAIAAATAATIGGTAAIVGFLVVTVGIVAAAVLLVR